MELKAKRYGEDNESTGGAMSVNGQFFCHTCEDEGRDVKVAGETRIPAGRYEIKLRDAGGMNEKYKQRFPFHRGMLHLQNVPDFEWIYIHPGSNEKQTKGCILVSYTAHSKNGFSLEPKRSVETYTDLYQLVLLAFERGESVFIEVEDI